MGCSSPPNTKESIQEKISKLRQLKNSVSSSIEINKSKIQKIEEEIQRLDTAIKVGEDDLRQNQHSYSEQEIKLKGKKLFDLQKDRQRLQKSLNLTSANNENLKNNLAMIESKIDELTNYIQLHAGDKVMKEIGNIDTGEILRKNFENILKQQKRDIEIIEASKKLNKILLGDMEFNSLNDYMEHILKNEGNNDAPVAY